MKMNVSCWIFCLSVLLSVSVLPCCLIKFRVGNCALAHIFYEQLPKFFMCASRWLIYSFWVPQVAFFWCMPSSSSTTITGQSHNWAHLFWVCYSQSPRPKHLRSFGYFVANCIANSVSNCIDNYVANCTIYCIFTNMLQIVS